MVYISKIEKPRPILFDLGDTLLNFSATNPLPYLQDGTWRAYEFMREQGVTLPTFKTYLRACRLNTFRDALYAECRRREVDLLATVRRVHRLMRLPREEDFLLRLAAKFYGPMKELGTVEEGIHDILQQFVKTGHPLAIVSNTMVPAPVLDEHLDQVGLLQYFPVRIYSCDVMVRKPNPRIFLAALRGLNARPGDCVFVGDRPRLDVKGAHRLGMITVLKVRHGTGRRLRNKSGYVVRHLRELPDLITNHIGTRYTDSTMTLSSAEIQSQHATEMGNRHRSKPSLA